MRKIHTNVPPPIIHTALYLYRIFAFVLEFIEPLIAFLKKVPLKVYFLFFALVFAAHIGHSFWLGESLNLLVHGIYFAACIFAVVLVKYLLFPLLLRFCKRTRVNIRTYFSPVGFKYVILKRKDICNYYSKENQDQNMRHPDNFSFKNSWK